MQFTTLRPGAGTPTFADLVHRLQEADRPAAAQRQQWCCAMRRIAHGLRLPLESVPGRWLVIRDAVEGLHHAKLACTPAP